MGSRYTAAASAAKTHTARLQRLVERPWFDVTLAGLAAVQVFVLGAAVGFTSAGCATFEASSAGCGPAAPAPAAAPSAPATHETTVAVGSLASEGAAMKVFLCAALGVVIWHLAMALGVGGFLFGIAVVVAGSLLTQR